MFAMGRHARKCFWPNLYSLLFTRSSELGAQRSQMCHANHVHLHTRSIEKSTPAQKCVNEANHFQFVSLHRHISELLHMFARLNTTQMIDAKVVDLARAKVQLQYMQAKKDRLEAARDEAAHVLEQACATMQVRHARVVLVASHSGPRHLDEDENEGFAEGSWIPGAGFIRKSSRTRGWERTALVAHSPCLLHLFVRGPKCPVGPCAAFIELDKV